MLQIVVCRTCAPMTSDAIVLLFVGAVAAETRRKRNSYARLSDATRKTHTDTNNQSFLSLSFFGCESGERDTCFLSLSCAVVSC